MVVLVGPDISFLANKTGFKSLDYYYYNYIYLFVSMMNCFPVCCIFMVFSKPVINIMYVYSANTC